MFFWCLDENCFLRHSAELLAERQGTIVIYVLDGFPSLNALLLLARNPSYHVTVSQLNSCKEALTVSWVLCKFCGIPFMTK